MELKALQKKSNPPVGKLIVSEPDKAVIEDMGFVTGKTYKLLFKQHVGLEAPAQLRFQAMLNQSLVLKLAQNYIHRLMPIPSFLCQRNQMHQPKARARTK